MDIKEFSVGDWIYNSKNEKCKICSIEGILEPYVVLDNYDKENDGCFEVDNNIQPIPLTDEIWKRNYFEANHLPSIESWEQWGLMIPFSGEIKVGRFATMEIKYVHQLQHLLRLCKIVSEIVL